MSCRSASPSPAQHSLRALRLTSSKLDVPPIDPHRTGRSARLYLDSRTYTLKLFDGLRSKIGFDVALCHDVHERLKPVEAIRFAGEL